ncbi:hypothetical protein [Salibacterium aidingense]|uniref:hypothetical protein n=1 Tax=Salibacterium aidingense TaxID=384933 RepID=UPI000409D903|nr:hypothetical protein [Salibacterium aidingense]
MRFSLIENGIDSLKVAGDILLNYYQDYEFENHQIKDALFSFVHGVEVLAKYVIREENEENIFSNKAEYSSAKQRMEEENADNIMEINPSIHTINLQKALNFLKDGKWEMSLELYDKLVEMKYFRNQLMHFTVELDEDSFLEFIRDLRITFEKSVEFFDNNISEFKEAFDRAVREVGLTEYETYLDELESRALMAEEEARLDAEAEYYESLEEYHKH